MIGHCSPWKRYLFTLSLLQGNSFLEEAVGRGEGGQAVSKETPYWPSDILIIELCPQPHVCINSKPHTVKHLIKAWICVWGALEMSLLRSLAVVKNRWCKTKTMTLAFLLLQSFSHNMEKQELLFHMNRTVTLVQVWEKKPLTTFPPHPGTKCSPLCRDECAFERLGNPPLSTLLPWFSVTVTKGLISSLRFPTPSFPFPVLSEAADRAADNLNQLPETFL